MDHTFDDKRDESFKEVYKILAQHGLCTTSQLCAEDQVEVYWVGTPAKIAKGFNIKIYGTSDQNLLSEIADVFVKELEDIPEMQLMDIRAYAPTADQVHNYFWLRRSTTLEIDTKCFANK